jgi:hypothetical protein
MEVLDLICFKCKHFDLINGGCDAFPNGIPDEITSGENKHFKPLPNQKNKIVFEPIETDK